jgi:hypothetical protein
MLFHNPFRLGPGYISSLQDPESSLSTAVAGLQVSG